MVNRTSKNALIYVVLGIERGGITANRIYASDPVLIIPNGIRPFVRGRWSVSDPAQPLRTIIPIRFHARAFP